MIASVIKESAARKAREKKEGNGRGKVLVISQRRPRQDYSKENSCGDYMERGTEEERGGKAEESDEGGVVPGRWRT